MNKKQMKLIYEYMRWKPYYTVHSDTVVYSTILDSNVAWEVVQELDRRGDWDSFSYEIFREGGLHGGDVEYWSNKEVRKDFIPWLFNPDNFFRCLGEFLEQREGKQA